MRHHPQSSSSNRLPRPLHRPLVDRQIHDHGNHRQPDRDQPHELVGAGAGEEVAAEPAAEEAAELVEEEHETRQHGEVLHAENSGDHAIGERNRAEPEESHGRGEQIGRHGRERKRDQQRDRDPARGVEAREQVGLRKTASELPGEVGAENVEQADERERDGAVANGESLVHQERRKVRADEDDLEAAGKVAHAEQPAALATPSTTLLFSAEYARPSAPNTILKVVQLMPMPTKMPIASVSPSAVVEFAMKTRPSAYNRPPAKSTRPAPKRSASIPVKGCVTPHSRFCNATAKPNTSRPHPLSMLIGCRNRPKLWRMPSARVRITLAQTSMTVGLGLRKSGMRIPDGGKATKDITQGAS